MAETSDQTSPEFLTVRELADLLRIKERKVYDLASTGAVPCSKVTGKLLFPEREVRAWIAQGSSATPGRASPRAAVFVGSHDPLLDWALRQSRCGIATYFDGSFDGLDRFAAGDGMATGLHIPGQGDWNVPIVADRFAGQNAVLISFARRQRGLIIRPDETAISGIADLAGRRFAPRQAESGSHRIFAGLSGQAGLSEDAYTNTIPARSEADAAMAVQTGDADAAFGLQALAQLYGLGFVSLIEERFDLLIDRKAWFEPPMQQLLAFLHDPAFAAHAAGMAGYDIAGIGTVRWNG
ncbi:helix-turn-helix transcriptional regulator [Puniceibacterium sp. IMCC21224]|uniref:helix-turn-helix transcriptional regulator n=1 Tax=Puniceibacterium sp. IMCC21224 TaxID=1618204 RepID=UPI00064D94C9|nr:helix-turn-helix transcriptional regulator [Puniceibacterium sp. IMCC21224]KMK68375.1 DNA-binding protein, excisionase family [Puniceibacterium sp. IMCC21224]